MRRPDNCAGLRYRSLNRISHQAPCRFGVFEGDGAHHEALDLDQQGASEPAGTNVDMVDSRDGKCSRFGSAENLRIDAVHQVADNVGGHLPADMDDEACDQESRYAVGPPQPTGDADQTEERTR